MNRHEKNLLLIAAALLLASTGVRFGHWSHSGLAPTLVLFGLTIGTAAVAQFAKRTRGPQPPRPAHEPPADKTRS